jgi:thymidylate kinase
VKEKYFEAFEILREKENVSVVNGNRPAKETADDIWNKVSKLVGSDSHHTKNTMQ